MKQTNKAKEKVRNVDKFNQKEIMDSELVDIAEGHSTTAFIFKRKNGSLHGFRVPTCSIELKSFTQKS